MKFLRKFKLWNAKEKRRSQYFGLSNAEKIAKKNASLFELQAQEKKAEASKMRAEADLRKAEYDKLEAEAKIQEDFIQEGEEDPDDGEELEKDQSIGEKLFSEVLSNVFSRNTGSAGKTAKNRGQTKLPQPAAEGDLEADPFSK